MEQIERIARMERYADEAAQAIQTLSEALDRYEAVQDHIHTLTAYYDSGLWLKDYEADEQGMIPETLKRGVLSQDAVYDLLSDNRELLLRLSELAMLL